MLNQVTNINTGTIANPYRQFRKTIPAGGIEKIRYDADFFAVLYTSSQDLAVNFSGSGGETEFWQGIKFKCPYTFTYAELINLNPTQPLEVVVGMGIGDVEDNRFSVSGGVNVQNTEATSLFVQNSNNTALKVQDYAYRAARTQQQTISSGSVQVTPPANVDVKFLIIQNTGNTPIRLFHPLGLIVNPLGTFEMNVAGSFSVYGESGSKFTETYFR